MVWQAWQEKAFWIPSENKRPEVIDEFLIPSDSPFSISDPPPQTHVSNIYNPPEQWECIQDPEEEVMGQGDSQFTSDTTKSFHSSLHLPA